MYNPMTTDYVRSLLPNLPPLKAAFLSAVNDFAYKTTWPIEGPLGEYARDNYDKDALIAEVQLSVRKVTTRTGGHECLDRLILLKAISDIEFHPNTIHCVEKAVEEEAIKIIERTSSVKDGKQICHIRNGHHGRQYIAANTAEAITINYGFGS